jgi:hypothetical protein
MKIRISVVRHYVAVLIYGEQKLISSLTTRVNLKRNLLFNRLRRSNNHFKTESTKMKKNKVQIKSSKKTGKFQRLILKSKRNRAILIQISFLLSLNKNELLI